MPRSRKRPAPAKLTVTVALPGTEFANDWEIWVYPAHRHAATARRRGRLTKKWDDGQSRVGRGEEGRALCVVGQHGQIDAAAVFCRCSGVRCGFRARNRTRWGCCCDPKHPLFAQFPTEVHSNWQWYELMQRSRLFILDDTAATYRPMVQVIDNFARNHKLGVVFEGRVGKGQLLVCGFDLPAMTRDPAARQLLASLYAYLGSPAFRPAQELGGDFLEGLFVSTSKLEKLHAHIRADSQAPGYDAAQAIDGDPDTMWHTPWGEGRPNCHTSWLSSFQNQ